MLTFNNTPTLFTRYPLGTQAVVGGNGAVHINGEYLAQFDSYNDAYACMLEAGWQPISSTAMSTTMMPRDR